MGVFSNMLERYSSPWRFIMGRATDKDQEIKDAEVQRALDAIVKTTQPFKMGGNLLAQGWGPAFRGLTGGDPNTPGAIESFMRESLTPEEQDYIDRKPYQAMLKSGAGMTATLMPFATGGLGAINYASNPLVNKTAQYALRGGVPGGLAGFGYSGEGNELRDTAIGTALGAGTSLVGGYLMDKSYRDLVNEGLKNRASQMYSGSLQLGDSIDSLREKAFREANIPEAEITKLEQYYKGMGADRDPYINDIELLQRGEKTQAGLDYMKALRDEGMIDPGQVNLPIKGYEAELGKGIRVYDISKASDRQTMEAMWGKEGLDEILEKGTYKGRDASEMLIKKGITIKGSEKDFLLDTLNPTGNVAAEYSPEVRANAPLGENITTLDKTMGRSPDEMITVYRGAPSSQGKLNPGDYITTNEELARSYAGTGKVIKERVRLGDILDDITEALGEEYIYRPMGGGADQALLQEAVKYKSPEEFVREWDRISNDMGERAFNDPYLEMKRITPQEERFVDMVYRYTERPEVNELYNKGWTDKRILTEVWNKAKGLFK
jgi:hypothetical protein